MKKHLQIKILLAIIILSAFSPVTAQTAKKDSTYLPPITISSLNGFGPYVIGTKRSNMFIIYGLPAKTSKITMKFVDVDGKQFNNAFIKEGSGLLDATWSLESDTMGFPLSPALNVSIEYQGDSIAVYNIPYKVYPDTIGDFASAGWGPVITNNYTRTDTSWHNVPEQVNTFSVNNLPPRTDTVEFWIISRDSTAIDSSFVIAETGNYLDSAFYENIRMDQLPLSADHLQIIIRCNGGPDEGIAIHKILSVIPQDPKLFCKVDGNILQDSLPLFIQNQTAGHALMIDTNKYAEMQYAPGIPRLAEYGIQYKGPYSFDIIEGEFTLEAWINLDANMLPGNYGEMTLMQVDSLWGIDVFICPYGPGLNFWSYARGESNLLTRVWFPTSDITGWHHLAYTYEFINGPDTREVKVYWDGNKLNSYYVEVQENNFIHVGNIPYKMDMKTNHLRFGETQGIPLSLKTIDALDEVRVWSYARTAEDIKSNYKKSVLQSEELIGYWNFDDRRNRLKIVSDLSYNNNTGKLMNGAYFIPQDVEIEHVTDTIIITSSNTNTDSIRFSFFDNNNRVFLSEVIQTGNSNSTLYFDISTLPYIVDRLQISEYYPGCPDSGYISTYSLEIIPPTPIVTPKYNWGTFYQSDGSNDEIKNTILVSRLPENVTKVELGLEKDNVYHNLESYTQNSIPYRYSLVLNGSDNYIETSKEISSPTEGEISLWFKTTTTKGGKLFGFSKTQNGVNSTHNDLEILLEKDGSLRFVFDTPGKTSTLYGEHAYNDGEWHFVTVDFGFPVTDLYVDGSLVDHVSTGTLESYNGYWIIGRNHANKNPDYKSLAEYFEGSLAEIYIWSQEKNKGELLYKLDEGAGTDVHDTKGNNDGVLMGGHQKWKRTSDKLSFLKWEGNMIDKSEGVYTFFARLFYPGGQETGAYYPLGKFNILNPLPNNSFEYRFSWGIGYFNEGVSLYNEIYCITDYTMQGSANWKEDFVQAVFMSPDHYIIDKQITTYTDPNFEITFYFDMGDAPPGSYMSMQLGYITNDNDTSVQKSFPVPVYINQMIAPTVSGDFGPFDQAIAPGTMAQENIFSVTTEHLDDLKKVKGVFLTNDGKEIDKVDAVQINDTTWHLTYSMGKLPPPHAHLKVEYYLGQFTEPALVEGPYVITIHRTRPKWFDFLADTAFHNIHEAGDSVTFSIITPFEQNYLVHNSETVTIPNWVPLIGGTSSELKSPTAEAYLGYHIPSHKLDFSKPPDFFQKVFNLGAGTASTLRFGFNYEQDNTYSLDDQNDLIATLNFSMGGSATTGFEKLENIAKKIKEIIEAAEVADPETIILSPSFDLTATGSFEYASRKHLITDTITGKWGSFGNLDVDANPNHHQAYKNSASYHFYSGAMGIEFALGVKLLEGLIEGDFGLDGRFLLGFGHSHNAIPTNKTKSLHSFAFQTYGRFYITVFWGWIERTLWGPKMFYNKTIWGDDMTNAFPPMKKKKATILEIPSDSTISGLLAEVRPVSGYSKLLLPHPQQSVKLRNNNRIFTWLEPGEEFGERNLRVRHYNTDIGVFSEPKTITSNNNALCDPVADMINDNLVCFAWTQSRHNQESINQVKSQDLLKEFAMSQDIWYSIYDLNEDRTLVLDRVDDDLVGLNTGRAEGRPDITILSDKRALLTWQVSDLKIHESDIWYTFIDCVNGEWKATEPAILSQTEGIETEVKIESPEENIAVAVWRNMIDPETESSVLMTSVFNGSYWTEPAPADHSKAFNTVNYFDMDFENDLGALVWTEYVKGPDHENYELLQMLPWNPLNMAWSTEAPYVLLTDSSAHMQLPRITIDKTGSTAITCKLETLGVIDPNTRISHIELFTGKINNINTGWRKTSANKLVCDTTKQVRELEMTFAGNDTLIILSHEYIMSATNMEYTPSNGVTFGDPYMNQVLRAVFINEDSEIEDVDENLLFQSGNDTIIPYNEVVLGQNYPNPCTNFTTIDFYLPAANNVKIEVLDISGHMVAILVDQKMAPGPYSIDLNTSVLKRGAYFYRMTTDTGVQTKKMIVGY
ncbi:MAG: T9SS type A sorting domain-containing protein [Bacteroidales bacterium]|nr:T9SS type A sorting domain-containing protein [Bacteroidales bacterium]